MLTSFCLISSLQGAEPVYLNTQAGIHRLEQADNRTPYFMVAPYIDTQENMGFCGPASMAAVLNSLPDIHRPPAPPYPPYRYFTQSNLFTSESSEIKSYAEVAHSGFTLQQASAFLRRLNVFNQIYWGTDLSAQNLRQVIKESLDNSDRRIIADFNRPVFGQEGGGHYSPIVAYDSATDSVLILDVAKFKYPPFWVTIDDLLVSLKAIDSDSGRSRGLIIIMSSTPSTRQP